MIVEGSENKAPVNAVIDPVTLADAIVQAQSRMGAQSQTAAPSKFRQHLDTLAKSGEEGAAQAAGTKELFDSFKDELTGEFASKTERVIAERLLQERNNQSLKYIDDQLDQFIGEDNDLKSLKSVMRKGIIEEWQTNKDLESHRQRYNAGDVDYSKLRELALAQVNTLNKFRKVDGKERGASGVTTRDSAANMGASSDAAEGSVYKYEDMKGEKEKGIWNGAMDIAQRRGIDPRSADADKFASRFIDKFRYPSKRRKESA